MTLRTSLGNQPKVAPVRERGLKSSSTGCRENERRRSREGAWIEINLLGMSLNILLVAPVRERGLK